jgi:hypothetical protein
MGKFLTLERGMRDKENNKPLPPEFWVVMGMLTGAVVGLIFVVVEIIGMMND